MIVEYYRPANIPEALEILENSTLKTVLIGGGTAINRYSTEAFAVLDLQDLGLNEIVSKGSVLQIGATMKMQSLFEYPEIQGTLKKVIIQEASQNLRQAATVAGTLIASDGRSPFATAMLALDASLFVYPGEEEISLGDFLLLGHDRISKRLVTRIAIPLNVRLAYEFVARTPADLPIVCTAVAIWPSGRTRVVLGGIGELPILALDGPDQEGADVAAGDAYSQAEDQWASAAYRQDVAKILVNRCLLKLNSDEEN